MVPGIAEQIPISLLSQGRSRIVGSGTTTWEEPRGTNTWLQGSVDTVWFVYSESDYIGQCQDYASRNRKAQCNTGSNLSNKRTFWKDTVLRYLKKHNEGHFLLPKKVKRPPDWDSSILPVTLWQTYQIQMVTSLVLTITWRLKKDAAFTSTNSLRGWSFCLWETKRYSNIIHYSFSYVIPTVFIIHFQTTTSSLDERVKRLGIKLGILNWG